MSRLPVRSYRCLRVFDTRPGPGAPFVLAPAAIGIIRNCEHATARLNVSGSASGSEGNQMSVERGVDAFAGFMVLLSVALTSFVHPGFVWLTVFVGANLFQQAFTGFCPAAIVMRKLGMRSERELAAAHR
jgi:hypothetical protein